MVSLVSLNLEDNMIQVIHPNAFAGLTRLKRLSLSKNRLSDIKPGIFGNAFALLGSTASFPSWQSSWQAILATGYYQLEDSQVPTLLVLSDNPLTSIVQSAFSTIPEVSSCVVRMSLNGGLSHCNPFRLFVLCLGYRQMVKWLSPLSSKHVVVVRG